MQIFKKPNFDFMKYKYIALGVSAVIILIGWSNILIGKGLNQGIDFAGGTLIRVAFQDETSTADVREALQRANLGTPQIQKIQDSKHEFQIRTWSRWREKKPRKIWKPTKKWETWSSMR